MSGGQRSFCGMKHVGLNVAADPLYTCSYTGVNAGMVIGVADDAGMHSSQNEQDSRHYAIAAKASHAGAGGFCRVPAILQSWPMSFPSSSIRR